MTVLGTVAWYVAAVGGGLVLGVLALVLGAVVVAWLVALAAWLVRR